VNIRDEDELEINNSLEGGEQIINISNESVDEFMEGP
jgi:hypothetical protein